MTRYTRQNSFPSHDNDAKTRTHNPEPKMQFQAILRFLVIPTRIITNINQRALNHTLRRRIAPYIRHRSSNRSPKPTNRLRCLWVTDNTESRVPRIQYPCEFIPTSVRLWPVYRRWYIQGLRVGIWITAAGVGYEIGLVRLGEGTEQWWQV